MVNPRNIAGEHKKKSRGCEKAYFEGFKPDCFCFFPEISHSSFLLLFTLVCEDLNYVQLIFTYQFKVLLKVMRT